jgi:hypothetical protein
MATSANDKAANIKAALEAYSGNKIDASPQQIEQVIGNTPYPFSSYSFTPPDPTVQGENIGKVVSRTIVVVRPPSCDAREILDVSAFVRIPDTGHATLRINHFLCPADQPTKRDVFYQEPAIIVATAESVTPIFVTLTHTFITGPGFTLQTDLQIDIFAWDSNGAPDTTSVLVNWRCRIPVFYGPIL